MDPDDNHDVTQSGAEVDERVRRAIDAIHAESRAYVESLAKASDAITPSKETGAQRGEAVVALLKKQGILEELGELTRINREENERAQKAAMPTQRERRA